MGARSRGAPRGMAWNQRATHAFAESGAKSPTMATVALLGAYQVRKNCLTSSSELACRSRM